MPVTTRSNGAPRTRRGESASNSRKDDATIPKDNASTDATVTALVSRCPSMKPTKCTFPLCDKVFSNAGNMRRHVKELHEGEKEHACETCGKLFRQYAHLKKHMKTHLKKSRRTKRRAA